MRSNRSVLLVSRQCEFGLLRIRRDPVFIHDGGVGRRAAIGGPLHKCLISIIRAVRLRNPSGPPPGGRRKGRSMVSAGSTALQRRAPAEGLAAPDNGGGAPPPRGGARAEGRPAPNRVGRPPAGEGPALVYPRGFYPAQWGGREVFVADLV